MILAFFIIVLALSFYIAWSAYNDFKYVSLTAELILKAYGFDHVESVRLSKHRYKANTIVRYREIFGDQLYPESYFNKND